MPTSRPGRLRRSALALALALPLTAAAGLSASPASAEIRLTPTNQLVWVPGVWRGQLHGVNPLTGKTVRTVQGGNNPMITAPSADGNTLYVVNLPKISQSGISIVNTVDGTRKFVGFKGVAAAEIMNNGGTELYGVDIVFHEIPVIDTATGKIVRRLPLKDHGNDEPLGIEISADNKTLYIAWLGGWVAAYDTKTGKVIREVRLPQVGNALSLGALGQFTLPGWLVLSPDGSRLYALNFATGNTSVIDTATWKDVGQIEHHAQLALDVLASFSPDGKKIYFSNYGRANVQVVSTETLQTLKTIKTKGRPIGLTTLDTGDVLVGTLPPIFTQIDPLLPILTLFPAGMLGYKGPNLGDGELVLIDGKTDAIKRTTTVKDTVPGAFVPPAPR